MVPVVLQAVQVAKAAEEDYKEVTSKAVRLFHEKVAEATRNDHWQPPGLHVGASRVMGMMDTSPTDTDGTPPARAAARPAGLPSRDDGERKLVRSNRERMKRFLKAHGKPVWGSDAKLTVRMLNVLDAEARKPQVVRSGTGIIRPASRGAAQRQVL